MTNYTQEEIKECLENFELYLKDTKCEKHRPIIKWALEKQVANKSIFKLPEDCKHDHIFNYSHYCSTCGTIVNSRRGDKFPRCPECDTLLDWSEEK